MEGGECYCLAGAFLQSMPDSTPSHRSQPVALFRAVGPLVAGVLLLAGVGLDCSSGSSSSECNAATCAGCCAPNGQCAAGDATSACGTAGATCAVCTASQQCTQALCVPPGPPVDAGCPGCASTQLLFVNDYSDWCVVTVNGAPLNASGSYAFDAGTVVDLDATPIPPFVWAYWLGTDGATGSGGHDVNMATTVTMNAERDVFACCQDLLTGQVCSQ
jgi:hypothetical protein